MNGTARGDVNGGRAGEGAGEEEEEEEHEDEDEEIEIPEVDVWVSSE